MVDSVQTNNIASKSSATLVDEDRKVPIETLYDVLPTLITKKIDLDLSKTTDAFVYLAGLVNEETNCHYQCLNFRKSIIPKYKKNKGLFSATITHSIDLIYGFYLPVKASSMQLQLYSDNKGKMQVLPVDFVRKTVFYNGASLQNQDGYVIFDNPIPLCILGKVYPTLKLEYTIDARITKICPETINKLIYPVFLCGMIHNDLRHLPISSFIPILKKEEIYLTHSISKEKNAEECAYHTIVNWNF